MTQSMRLTVIKTLVCIGVSVGFWAGWNIKEMSVRVAEWEHERRCTETTKYWQYPGKDLVTGSKLCFRQSKLTGRFERTTLVYNEQGKDDE